MIQQALFGAVTAIGLGNTNQVTHPKLVLLAGDLDMSLLPPSSLNCIICCEAESCRKQSSDFKNQY